MKRLMFGIMLTVVGLSFSLVCFYGALSNPWYMSISSGVIGIFEELHITFPFLLSLTLMLVGLVITLFETYRKR